MLERHGTPAATTSTPARPSALIRDLARIYEGTLDYPYGRSSRQAPSPPTAPEPSGPDGRDAVIVSASEVKTVLAALDVAADYKRDRAETCADCPDQSCPACQSRLHDAGAYDQMADRMLQAAEAALTTHHRQAEPRLPAPSTQAAADKEAGQ